MKSFDTILKAFEVDKEIHSSYVLVNISPHGSEYISPDKHLEQGIIQNIYFNDHINKLEQCYIFSSMLNALSFFSMYPILIKEKVLLVITGKCPTDSFIYNLKKVTKEINKFYFCIDNTIHSKLINTKLFIAISLGDNINIKELQANQWLVTYDKKEIYFTKITLSGISKLEKKLRTFDLKRKLYFEFIAPQRQFHEFKNLYNYESIE